MALKDKLMTLEDFKAVRDVDVASNSAQFTEIKADLQDLEETVDAMEPGLSDAAKAALLACLREIPFLDSSTNYAVLEAALFNNYPKITVSYNPGQNIIYTDYELDALKTYMTVKYYESSSDAGITISSANYTLSGTLTEGVNSILCQYGNYTAAVAVTAVNRILYALENPVILDGSTYIDTGIDLLTTNRSFTILIDAVDACNHYTDTENKYTVQYAQNSSPWYQLNIQTYNGGTGGVASGKHKVRSVARVTSPSGVTKSIFDYVENISAPDTTKHNRSVIRYDHTTGTFSFAMSRDGSKITPTTVEDNGYTYTQINRNLRISNNTQGFTGTIYVFNVYNYACSDAEINNFLGGN